MTRDGPDDKIDADRFRAVRQEEGPLGRIISVVQVQAEITIFSDVLDVHEILQREGKFPERPCIANVKREPSDPARWRISRNSVFRDVSFGQKGLD